MRISDGIEATKIEHYFHALGAGRLRGFLPGLYLAEPLVLGEVDLQ